jgi:ribonuclease-3
MEEVPAMAVPDTEQEEEFIVGPRSEESGVRSEDTPAADSSRQGNPAPHSTLHTPQDDDFDLSDLSVKPKEKTREDIIAEAEAAAFAEAEG